MFHCSLYVSNALFLLEYIKGFKR